MSKNQIELKIPEGKAALFHMAPGIMRLRFSPKGKFEPPISGFPVPEFKASGSWEFRKHGPVFIVESGGLKMAWDSRTRRLSLAGEGTGFFQGGGFEGLKHDIHPPKEILVLPPTKPWGLAGAGTGVRFGFTTPAAQSWFGLGEKVRPLDKMGQAWDFFNNDAWAHGPGIDPLYKTIPFLLGRVPEGQDHTYWGLLVDNPSRTKFVLGLNRPGEFEFQAEYGELDAWFFAGPEPAQVLNRYTQVTGRPFLPPLWSLGYHQSRWGYRSAADMKRVAGEFKRRDLPLECIHFDIDYMDGFRVFTFNPKTFKNPKSLIAGLKKEGIHVTTIVDPGVKKDPQYPVYQDGLKRGAYCGKKDGGLYQGNVWPGLCVFPDFFKKEASRWWGSRHKFLLDAGVEGIWNDMNEPAIFEDAGQDMRHQTVQGPRKHEEVHNAFGSQMTRATAEGLKRLQPDKRHFLLTRAAYAGIQKYSSVWLGDNRSGFEFLALSLSQLQGLGISGVPFCGADVGGFAYPASGELLARWTQAGALTPFFRNHNRDGRAQEPWAFGEPYLSICRKYLKLRSRLLPYIYTLFEESHRTGAPVMRPMLWEFPQDDEAFNLGDQFMLGPLLLAAPVVKAGARAREVWLPSGVWTDFWTGERLRGGRYHLALAPLDTLPLFLRQGAILPMWKEAPNSDRRDRSVLCLDLHPFPGESSFSLYEDDGLTRGFEKGKSSRLDFNMVCDMDDCRILLMLDEPRGRFRPAYREIELRVHGLQGRPRQVRVDGKTWPFSRVPGKEKVHGLQPGHFQARLQVPFKTREVVLEGVPGIVGAK